MNELGISMSEGSLTICADGYTLMGLQATIKGLLEASATKGTDEELSISRRFQGKAQHVDVTFKMIN